MEFVRTVVQGMELKDVIEIPTSLINKKVEVLIFPIDEAKKGKKKKNSLAGSLSKYANPSLIKQEEHVWQEEAKE